MYFTLLWWIFYVLWGKVVSMDRLRADSCVVTSLHAVTMISKCNTSLFYAPKPILLFQKHNMAINLKPKTLLVCVELNGHPYTPLANSNTTGPSSLGAPGVPWHTQILADQLTLFQPGGTDYAHLITTGTPGFSDLPTALLSKQVNALESGINVPPEKFGKKNKCRPWSSKTITNISPELSVTRQKFLWLFKI